MVQTQLYGSSATLQDPLSKTANSQREPGASHEHTRTLQRCLSLAVGSHQGPCPSLLDRALQHDGALDPDSRLPIHGRGRTVMLQRTQLFGLVKAILLDDLQPDESKQMGRVGTAVSTHRQASTQLFAPCGRGACRTFSTHEHKRPNQVQISYVLMHASHIHTQRRVYFPEQSSKADEVTPLWRPCQRTS